MQSSLSATPPGGLRSEVITVVNYASSIAACASVRLGPDGYLRYYSLDNYQRVVAVASGGHRGPGLDRPHRRDWRRQRQEARRLGHAPSGGGGGWTSDGRNSCGAKPRPREARGNRRSNLTPDWLCVKDCGSGSRQKGRARRRRDSGHSSRRARSKRCVTVRGAW